MGSVEAGKYKNPPHVLQRLATMLVHYKGVWAEMERKLGLSRGKLSHIRTGRAPVTQELLDLIYEKSKVRIPLEPPSSSGIDAYVAGKIPVPPGVTKESLGKMKTPAADPEWQKVNPAAEVVAEVVAVGLAMQGLSHEAENLLVNLLKFRLGEETYSPRVVVGAIQDIASLKGVLTDD